MNEKTKNKKILVVDDDETILGVLDIVLRDFGYKTLLASEVESAIEMVNDQEPDLILLDLIMPKKDGTELLKIVKTGSDLSKIPVVLISSSHKLKEVARDYKADAFIEKPFDIEKLYKIINEKI